MERSILEENWYKIGSLGGRKIGGRDKAMAIARLKQQIRDKNTEIIKFGEREKKKREWQVNIHLGMSKRSY